MTTIKKMDKAAAREIGATAEKVLATICQSLGVSVAYRGGTIGEASCVLKFEFTIAGGPSLRDERAAEEFKYLASIHGFKASDLGAEFRHPTLGECTITGLRAKASKQPVLFKTSDGKAYVGAAAGILSLLRSARS